ncbi:MAG TPA: AAA family ATPase [Fimbriimonadaceae bacterium]|nr:AAA family ATPase [Fimbriimonadaceae bacterium]
MHDAGWCLVPVPHGSKFPSLPWKQYQTERPSLDRVREWFSGDENGVCAVCGAVSGNLVALDFDAPGSYEAWCAANAELARSLPTAKTTRGHHVFFRTPDPAPSTALFLNGFEGKAGDVLGSGKLAVLPPTRHPSGFIRHWVIAPTEALPVLTLAQAGVQVADPVDARLLDRSFLRGTIPVGDRHEALMRLAAKLRSQGNGHAMITDLLFCVNDSRCEVPVPRQEIQGIADWASRLPPGTYHEVPHDPHYRIVRREECPVGNSTFLPHSVCLEEERQSREERFGHLFRTGTVYMAGAGDEDYSWVVEDLLPETYLVVLGGTSKAGKSCLMTSLALAVARGEEFLGRPTQQAAVLWCCYEESEQERALVLRACGEVPDSLYITHEKLHIDTPDGLEALRFWVQKTGAKLIVIDPLYGANTQESLSDGRKARTSLAGLKELCATEKCCAVVLHHITKNVGIGMTRERFADSNQILATASMDVLLDVVLESEQKRVIRLQGRGRGSFANRVWLIESSGIGDYHLTATGTDAEVDSWANAETILGPMREAGKPLTGEEVAELVDQKLATVRNRLTQLVKSGEVVAVGKRDRSNLYTVADSQPRLAEATG